MDDSFVSVMRSDDLVAGDDVDARIRRARLGDTPVLLARLADGAVVAFGATCPHQATDLELAKLWDGNVRCARHNYLYDPRTGENIVPTRDHLPDNLWKLKPGYLPVYEAVERDGWIYLGPRLPPPASYNPALEVRPPGVVEAAVEEPIVDEEVVEALRVQVGATFELRLPMSPLPGYAWQVEVDGPLTVLGDSAIDDEEHELRVTVEAAGTGDAFVRCGYSAPWEAEPSEFRNYEVHVVDSE